MTFQRLILVGACATAVATGATAQETTVLTPSQTSPGLQVSYDGFDFKLSGRLGAGATLLNHQTGGATTRSLIDNC